MFVFVLFVLFVFFVCSQPLGNGKIQQDTFLFDVLLNAEDFLAEANLCPFLPFNSWNGFGF